jgi:hypothetical protein
MTITTVTATERIAEALPDQDDLTLQAMQLTRKWYTEVNYGQKDSWTKAISVYPAFYLYRIRNHQAPDRWILFCKPLSSVKDKVPGRYVKDWAYEPDDKVLINVISDVIRDYYTNRGKKYQSRTVVPVCPKSREDSIVS